jgi:outer membrane lipoprotein SlyB
MDNKFAASLWAIGGVSTVIWATLEKRKGRFWWFMGGAIIGGAVGAIIDAQVNKKETVQKTLSL